jgi:hypothetical protein
MTALFRAEHEPSVTRVLCSSALPGSSMWAYRPYPVLLATAAPEPEERDRVTQSLVWPLLRESDVRALVATAELGAGAADQGAPALVLHALLRPRSCSTRSLGARRACRGGGAGDLVASCALPLLLPDETTIKGKSA